MKPDTVKALALKYNCMQWAVEEYLFKETISYVGDTLDVDGEILSKNVIY